MLLSGTPTYNFRLRPENITAFKLFYHSLDWPCIDILGIVDTSVQGRHDNAAPRRTVARSPRMNFLLSVLIHDAQ